MIEVKEQSGYSKANVSGQNLNGSVPVIDLSRGGLKSAFAAFAAKEKSPLEADAKDNKAQNKPAEAKAEQPARDDQDKQPEAKNPDASRQNENTTQEPAKLEQTGYTPPQAFAPKFAPTIAAGALSMVQQKAAQRPKASYEDPDHETDADVFNLGKRSLKRVQKGILDEDSGGYGNNSTKESDDLMQNYAQWQQQQAFMQTVAYSTALSTVRDSIRENEEQLNTVEKEIAVLEEKKIGTEAAVAESTEKVAKLETQEKAAVKLEGAQEEHAGNVAKYNQDSTELNKVDEKLKELPTVKIIPSVNETYYQKQENGQEVTYRVGQDGVAQKIKPEEISAEALCNLPMATYIKTMPDGSTQYVNQYDRPLDQSKADNLKKFMESTGQNPESLAKAEQAQELQQQQSEKLDKVIQSADSASKSEVAVATAKQEAIAAGIPPEKLENVQKFLTEIRGDLNEAREELERAIKEDKFVGDKLTTQYENRARLETDGKALKKFETDLKDGKFKNEKEMIKAMPESMKKRYEEELARAPAENQPKNSAQTNAAPPTASTNNTSRTNGSAAPPAIAASADVGDQFAAAAAGTPTTANEPAPVADKELVAAANAPKASTAAGMSV